MKEARVTEAIHIFDLWYSGSIFIQIFIVGSEKQFCATECMMAIQGYPRSLILVSIESVYATSC